MKFPFSRTGKWVMGIVRFERPQSWFARRRWLGALSAVLLSWASPRTARASGFPSCLACGTWLPTGINGGTVIDPRSGFGWLLGGEVSVVKVTGRAPPGYGAYVDALYDGQLDSWRFSLGPEVIVAVPFGLDAGPVLQVGSSGTHVGARFRAFVPYVVTPYIAEVVYFDTTELPPMTELGILVKFPIPLSN